MMQSKQERQDKYDGLWDLGFILVITIQLAYEAGQRSARRS